MEAYAVRELVSHGSVYHNFAAAFTDYLVLLGFYYDHVCLHNVPFHAPYYDNYSGFVKRF